MGLKAQIPTTKIQIICNTSTPPVALFCGVCIFFLTVGEACRDVQTSGLFVTQIVQKNNQSLTAVPQSGGKSLTGHRKPANHSLFFAYIGSANTGIRTIVTGIRTDFAGIRTVTN